MNYRCARGRVALATVASLSIAAGCARPHTVQRSASSVGDLSGRLQARLDRVGGLVFLPRLPGGRCYRSRGLWVSHSGTTIESDGACLVVVGPGPVRLRSADGDPIAASAAFFISRSAPSDHPPENITIRGLRIILAPGSDDGIDVYASRVRIADVSIEGSPFDDVYIGGRTNVAAYASQVTLSGSRLEGAQRNAISITAAVGVRITHNVIASAGVELGYAADPGDGIDVEPNAPSNPILRLLIAYNRIVDNVGSGIALRLRPSGGLPRHADRIAIIGNRIVGNSPWQRQAAISLAGGQADGRRHILILGNSFEANGGSDISRTDRRHVRLSLGGNVDAR